MADVFLRCADWKDDRTVRWLGFYPYYQALGVSQTGAEIEMGSSRVIMIGSNNYLGLADDSRVKEAAASAARKYGSTCSGSRLLNGTRDLHERLEHQLAQFLKRDAVLCVSTGFQTNLAALAILGRKDIAFCDRRNHASLVDGVALSRAREKRYAHHDLGTLETQIQTAEPSAGKLIVTDAVFSMEGDLCNLPKLARIRKAYGTRLLIDDAHGVGVLGQNGRGTAEYFDLEDETDLITGTFSKSFASLGGFVAGPTEVIQYIKHKARAVVFSASMTPASAAAAITALEVIQAEPQRRARVLDIAQKMNDGLRALGFDTGYSCTPIVPVAMGDLSRCLHFWRELIDAGVFANPVVPPAVEPGSAVLRTSYMAMHTDSQLQRVLDSFESIGKRLGVIPKTRPSFFVRAQIARPGSPRVIPQDKSALSRPKPNTHAVTFWTALELLVAGLQSMFRRLFRKVAASRPPPDELLPDSSLEQRLAK